MSDAKELMQEELVETLQILQQDLCAFKNENEQLNAEVITLHEQLDLLQQQMIEAESEYLTNEQNGSKEIHQLHQYRTLFCQLPYAFILIDGHGQIQQVNQKASELLNLSEVQLLTTNFRKLLSVESSFMLLNAMRQQKIQNSPEMQSHFSHFVTLLTGQMMTLNVHYVCDEALGGSSFCHQYILSLQPIALNTLSEQSLRIAHIIIDQLREGVMITDAKNRIIKVNQAFCEITGYTQNEVIGGCPSILQSGRHTPGFYKEMWVKLQNNGWWAGEIWNKRKSGEVYPEWLQISRIKDEANGQVFYAATFADITERKEHQHQLDRLAFYDALTGLPNRTLLNQFLEVQLSRACPNGNNCLAVFFIDLDKFKEVNDHFGHAEGDIILREATQRITSRIRENDLASRIGGDEFVLVLSRLQSENNADEIAKDIIELLATPYQTSKAVHRLSATIGIAFFPTHGVTGSDLMRRADAAMYRAKALGRNRFQVFEVQDETHLVSTNQAMHQLWKAIEEPHKYIEMHYQPIFCAVTQVLLEYEALVRLKDDKGALIYPDQFIEVAEQNGLITKLGLVIFESVCRDVSTLPVVDRLNIDVNLSVLQFQDVQLLEQLLAIAQKYQLSLSQFNFEVTETATMQNLNSMVNVLEALQSNGCNILLDDFGTGFASLSMLKNLPINVVKIDRSFISELETSDEARSLVKAMIAMAKALSLKITTEGVETQAQLDWLVTQKVDYIQGYLLGKPQKSFYKVH
ncbi:EAL domain-containing protein [Thiomicrorhabdus aquaedulcis]|uniref:sensor domain-containing protein n=1 Tax=Thiomicrorhabdus aquaedulcis TaxID=2211106 RepID=UPI000FDB345A|nr:EAL domain-containing protein [Thiomicrorhabdus aquaedulcis]